MVGSTQQTSRRGHQDSNIAKRQAVFLVSVVATILILWPERLKVYRDLCIVPLLAWLTSLVFDLSKSIDQALENAPRLLKYFIPINVERQVATPFEQISRVVAHVIDVANLQARLVAFRTYHMIAESKQRFHVASLPARLAALRIYHKAVEVKQRFHVTVIIWLLHQLGNEPRNEIFTKFACNTPAPSRPSPPSRPSGLCYGILVATPSAHDYGFIGIDSSNNEPPYERIPWESIDMSRIPPVFPPSTFRTSLSFCLVPNEVWESTSTTIVDKMKAGVYWNNFGNYGANVGDRWTEDRIRDIKGVEVLGVVSGERVSCVEACHNYFTSLLQNWEYVDIYWNDVDFAIILGFLVIGTQAADKSAMLFANFEQLRIEQVLVSRRKAPAKGFMTVCFAGVAAGVLTVVTGGLAAPVVAPIIFHSGAAGLGRRVIDAGVSARDSYLWKTRRVACRDLVTQFEQLEVLFS